ncbi:MFS general substrate transporter-31 [Mycena venus]|uniref:MFS general substrate transporter-31 n=1 Tax=Mycena venus TaxID=2733690 RepID=A0A8H6WUH8_9AGAR|nr:MFS general substrate transporter-31 [Mycena venus]
MLDSCSSCSQGRKALPFLSPMPTAPTFSEKSGSNEKVDDNDAVVQVDQVTLNEDNYTPADYTRVVRKVDRYLLPLMWICYGTSTAEVEFRFINRPLGIQQSDKTSLGNQAIFGLRTDTHLKGQEYQWLTTIFYMTYLIGEFPSNFLLQRWAMGRTLSIYMLCWGICVVSISVAQNWTHLMVIRALQGFFECTISPGFVLIIGTWYRTEEHAARALFWQSANAGFGIISDLCSYGIGLHAKNHPGGLAPWRGISLFLGSATILCAIACFFLLGSPKEVRWLSREDKNIVAARILKNKAGRDVTGVKWDWEQVIEAFLDPQLYFCGLNAFLSSVPNGGLTTFGSIMYASFGFTELQVLLVGIPRSVVSVLLFVAVMIFSGRVKNIRMWVMAFATVPPFVGILALSLLPNEPDFKWIKWGMYLITVPYVLSLFLGWTLIPSNVAGRTKKTIISSGTFLCYCVGNMW